jgi:hypothetical protein
VVFIITNNFCGFELPEIKSAPFFVCRRQAERGVVVVQSVLGKWPGPAFVWPRLILKKLNNNTYKETV